VVQSAKSFFDSQPNTICGFQELNTQQCHINNYLQVQETTYYISIVLGNFAMQRSSQEKNAIKTKFEIEINYQDNNEFC
jgi:hypothetical protein